MLPKLMSVILAFLGLKYVIYSEHSLLASDGERAVKVERKFRHPKFDYWEFDYDYGIIKLARPIKFSDKVYPVCLPVSSRRADLRGKGAIVSGWGEGSRNVLRKTAVR